MLSSREQIMLNLDAIRIKLCTLFASGFTIEACLFQNSVRYQAIGVAGLKRFYPLTAKLQLELKRTLPATDIFECKLA